MSRTNCPKNGIKTNDGNCFYLSKEDCPLPRKVIEEISDYAMITDLLRTTPIGKRVCMLIYDSDIKNIFERQPEYMKKLREENQIHLDKSIQDDESLHIAFQINHPDQNAIITIQDSTRDDIYFGRIQILNEQLSLSMNTEMLISPVVVTFDKAIESFYELDIRFTNNRIKVINASTHKEIAQIDLSLNSIYSADMISIENIEVYQLEHHDMKCQSETTYHKKISEARKLNEEASILEGSFKRKIIQNFNLHSEDTSQLSLPARTEWSETFIFHLIRQNSSDLDLKLEFRKNNGDIGFEYKCSKGEIFYEYLEWVTTRDGFKIIKEQSEITVSPSDDVTFGMFTGDRKMTIFVESGGKVVNKIEVNHPCPTEWAVYYECEYKKHEIKITSKSSNITGFEYFNRRNSVEYCFSDYWISGLATKVPYQSDCGKEKYLNICRIRRDVPSESYQPLSTESSVSDEQDEKFLSSISFPRKEIVESKPVTVIAPYFLLAICSLLNLINIILECVEA